MTDKELLELAAKAAFPDCAHIDYPLDWVRDCVGDWNPLDNDGDALRLAVKLAIAIRYSYFDHMARAALPNDMVVITEFSVDDPYAATRRAIVRAAAEIWRTK
jgi:hypothetical protein